MVTWQLHSGEGEEESTLDDPPSPREKSPSPTPKPSPGSVPALRKNRMKAPSPSLTTTKLLHKKNVRNPPTPSLAIKPLEKKNRKAPVPKQLAAKNERAAPFPAKLLPKRNEKKVLSTKPSPTPTFTRELRSRGLKVSGVKLQEEEKGKKASRPSLLKRLVPKVQPNNLLPKLLKFQTFLEKKMLVI